MRRSLYSNNDTFAQAPLLALLPNRGSAAGLEALSTSLFARYERVGVLKSQLGDDASREALRRVTAEEAMLKQVMDWLKLDPAQAKPAAEEG